MKKIVLLFIISGLFSSCNIHVEVSKPSEIPGFNSGYNKLTDEDKKIIIKLSQDSTSHIPAKNDGNIYAVNALQLQNYLNKTNECIVYLWSPYCSSLNCISLKACQDFCDQNHYPLIVIAEYYNMDRMKVEINSIISPLLIVDHTYYKTDYCPRYNRRFKKDLLKSGKKKTFGYHYWYFKKGSFQKSVINISELKRFNDKILFK